MLGSEKETLLWVNKRRKWLRRNNMKSSIWQKIKRKSKRKRNRKKRLNKLILKKKKRNTKKRKKGWRDKSNNSFNFSIRSEISFKTKQKFNLSFLKALMRIREWKSTNFVSLRTWFTKVKEWDRKGHFILEKKKYKEKKSLRRRRRINNNKKRKGIKLRRRRVVRQHKDRRRKRSRKKKNKKWKAKWCSLLNKKMKRLWKCFKS